MPITSDILNRYKALPTGNICDANGKTGNMDSGIRPVFSKAKLAGTAVTVKCQPADNLTMHKAIYEANPSEVLVIDACGYTNAGHVGEIMVMACMERGLAGIVLDGGSRDSDDIEELGYPVFSRGFNPGGTVKESIGEINTVITCGGVAIAPGDLIVGDRDGVVVVKKENIETVLNKAEALFKRELEVRELLKQGKTSLEIYGFDKSIAGKEA